MQTRCLIALLLAVIYIALAIGFVRADRKSHTGGFINLQGMLSSLVVLPVAFPLEYWGHAIDFRNNWQMTAAILFCGVLVFGISFGGLSLAAATWQIINRTGSLT